MYITPGSRKSVSRKTAVTLTHAFEEVYGDQSIRQEFQWKLHRVSKNSAFYVEYGELLLITGPIWTRFINLFHSQR